MGLSHDVAAEGVFRAEITEGLRAQLGRLIEFENQGDWTVVADVGHADFQWSADHKDLVPDQFPDANPYGLLAGRHAHWVVDAGSNTIDRVEPDGDVTIQAFIPNPASTDVPLRSGASPPGRTTR